MRISDLDNTLVEFAAPYASPTTGSGTTPTQPIGGTTQQTPQPNIGGTQQPDPKQRALVAADIQKEIKSLQDQKVTLQKQMQDIDKQITELNRRKSM